MTVLNLTSLAGRNVYTRNAKYVGKIEDTIVDTEKGGINGFAVTMARESFLYKTLSPSEQGVKKNIMIPYREVIACDDVVLVTVPKQYEKAAAMTEEDDEVILPGVDEE
ncbi:MAG: PRC-barrel domain-containing protein [archaeon]